MITNPKTLVDMGANAAIMVAFTIPGSGPVIAAGIATGLAVFDIFFEIPDRTDPGVLTPTHNDLTNALNELKQYINDANFNTLMSQYQASIMTLNGQLNEVWAMAPSGDAVRDRARRGPFFQTSVSTAQVDSWRKEISGYQDTILASNPDILQVVNWIEGDPVHTSRTLGLYALAGSLWVNFCKLNIAFEFILAMHDYGPVKAKYESDLADFNSRHNVWKLVGKANGDDEPVAPVAPLEPINDDNFFNGSVFADKAKTYLDQFIAYYEPIVSHQRGNFDHRAAEMKNRLDAITLSGGGTSWSYVDAKTGKTSAPAHYRQIADAQMQTYKGSIQVALWDRLTTQYGLANLAEDDLKTLETVVTEWKKASLVLAPL